MASTSDECGPDILTVHKFCCETQLNLFSFQQCRDLCLTAVECSSVKSRLIDFCGAMFFIKDTVCT